MEILSWLFFIVFIGALIVVGGLLLKGYITTGSPTSGLTAIQGAFFGPKPEKRLEIMDQMNVDGRRRLVLIRRDNVEHLLMTGGPVDVVIETGIGQQPVVAAQAPSAVPTDRMAFAEGAPTRDPHLAAPPVSAGAVPPRQGASGDIVEPSVFSRPARSLGQAVGDN